MFVFSALLSGTLAYAASARASKATTIAAVGACGTNDGGSFAGTRKTMLAVSLPQVERGIRHAPLTVSGPSEI